MEPGRELRAGSWKLVADKDQENLWHALLASTFRGPSGSKWG